MSDKAHDKEDACRGYLVESRGRSPGLLVASFL